MVSGAGGHYLLGILELVLAAVISNYKLYSIINISVIINPELPLPHPARGVCAALSAWELPHPGELKAPPAACSGG